MGDLGCDELISREWRRWARMQDRLCDELFMLKCGWTPNDGWFVDKDISPELQTQFRRKGWTPPADRPSVQQAPEQTPEAPLVKAPPPGFVREPKAPPQQAPKAPSHQLPAHKAPPAGWPFVQQIPEAPPSQPKPRFKAPPAELERRQKAPPPHPPVYKAPPAGWQYFEQAPQAPPPQTAVAANCLDVFGSPPSSIDSMR